MVQHILCLFMTSVSICECNHTEKMLTYQYFAQPMAVSYLRVQAQKQKLNFYLTDCDLKFYTRYH